MDKPLLDNMIIPYDWDEVQGAISGLVRLSQICEQGDIDQHFSPVFNIAHDILLSLYDHRFIYRDCSTAPAPDYRALCEQLAAALEEIHLALDYVCAGETYAEDPEVIRRAEKAKTVLAAARAAVIGKE